MVVHTLFLIACFATGVISSDFILPCKVSDERCIDEYIRETIPLVLAGNASLGVESSDPLFVEKIEINLLLIKYALYNFTVRGLGNCEIIDIRLTTDLEHLHYELKCDNVSLSGQYEMNGLLIIFPVKGKGEYEIITGQITITVDAELKKYVGSDGKHHLAIESFELESEALTEMKFNFKNLFNGQKFLSDAAHNFARKNWRQMAKLYQNPTWHAIEAKVISNVNNYLQYISLEDTVIE